jgi:NADH-ubiquinone oxidoreductase chain 5
LALGSLFSGYILKDAFVGIGTLFWKQAIFKLEINTVGLDLEFIPLSIKNLPIIFSFVGIFFALNFKSLLLLSWTFLRSKKNLKLKYPQSITPIVWFFCHKWYFDFVYNYFLGYTILEYSYHCFYILIDKGFIEVLSLNGLTYWCYKISIFISRSQIGTIYNLNCFLFLGLLILFFVVLCI